MAIRLHNQLIRAAIRTVLDVEVPTEELCVLGVRGMVPYKHPEGGVWLSLRDNVHDEYNDALVLFGTHLRAYLASVDPGSTYTQQPLNPDGAAHLLPGHYLYRLGFHKGKRALVQAAPVTVRRDGDRDGIAEPGERLQRDWLGINIHAAGTGERVGPHSAGCQVIHGGWDGRPWQEFIETCVQSRQGVYHYYLIDGPKLAAYVDRLR